MDKWELAYLLIKAKKCIDSISYIKDNLAALQHIDVAGQVDNMRKLFYIELYNILYECKLTKNTKEKARSDLELIEEIVCYERNKREAHRDKCYEALDFATMGELIGELTSQISHIKRICSSKLPSVITLDFVSHDDVLFRLVNGIRTSGIEQELIEEIINARKEADPKAWEEYLEWEKNEFKNANLPEGFSKRVMHSPEQLMRDKQDINSETHAITMKEGLTSDETLQRWQDFCIKSNILFGGDMWCQV